MSVLLFFLLIVGVGVGVIAIVAVAPEFTSDARAERRAVREARAETQAVKAREKIATKALRAIANGAGNPILEAQDALDNMETTYTKEIE